MIYFNKKLIFIKNKLRAKLRKKTGIKGILQKFSQH